MTTGTKGYEGKKALIIVTYLCMITFGLLETLKGAVIPSIRGEFGVDYGQIGQMLFIALLGYLISTFLAGMATDKYGLKNLFLFGITVVIIASGLFMVVPGFYGIVGVYFLLGIGLGCFEVGVNALGGQIFQKNAAMMMNLMHLFFGVGAMIAPRYAGAFIDRGYSWKSSYLLTIGLTLIVMVIVLFAKFPQEVKETAQEKVSFKQLTKSPKVWLIAVTLGFFIVIEAGMANWLVNYLQEVRSLDVISSTSYLTWYFGLFTFGRLVGGFIADKVGYIKSLFYYTAMATILLLAGILLGNTFLLLFSLVGFFTSIMFPTMMVLIMKEYKSGVGAIMGFAITISGIFNMVGGWLIGNINDLWGVSAGMITLVISGIVACILLIVLEKKSDQTW